MKINKNNFTRASFKKNISRLCFSVSLLMTTSLVAAEDFNIDYSSTALTLGTPASFLAQLAISESKQVVQLPTTFALVDNLGEQINVVTDHFSVEKDGTLSMNGQVQGVENSAFIMQGDDDNVYGWIILEEQDVAYEYTTKNGRLVVDEIEIAKVLPVCDLQNHDHSTLLPQAGQALLAASQPHIGAYQGEDVSLLESKPGSAYVVLLDTSKIMSGNTPTDRSKENLWTTWQIVAASFSMFDVNVTTNRTIYEQAAPSRRGGGTLYTQTGRSSCHFAFGTATFCTLYKESDAYGQGRIAAHEFGHLFHLAHDGGSPGGEYHNGLADFQWVPVMGNIWYGTGWTNALYQWSKGEYSGASNREDDFNILTGFIPFKTDDIAGSQPLVIEANGSVSAVNNSGQIERNTDTDHFTFTIGASGGHANVTIDRTEHIGGAMLDVQATLKSSSGAVIAQSNNSVNRSAAFNTSLAAGIYTLEISGGAEGTPSHGFSKYSSLGYYAIEGNISGADGGTDIDIPVSPTGLQSSNVTSNAFTVTWNAVAGASSYGLQRSTDSANTWLDAGTSTTPSKSLTGLTAKDQWVRVKATNSLGSSAYSNAIYVELANTTTPPAVPSGLVASNVTSNSFLLNWTAVEGASGYSLQRWTDLANAWLDAGTSTTSSKNITGLSEQEQWIRVKATNLAGSSNYSSYIYVQLQSSGCTNAPAVPTGLSGNSQAINWQAVAGATGYNIQYWTGTWTDHGSASTTSYALGLSGTQYVRVRATNSCGNSNYSNWVAVY